MGITAAILRNYAAKRAVDAQIGVANLAKNVILRGLDP